MLFDDILREIGEFGPYQILLYILLGLAGIPTGFQNMSITFLGGEMDHWCHIPELKHLPKDQQRYIAIPQDGATHSYSQCHMYDIDYSGYDMEDLMGWNRSRHIDAATPTKTCSSWQYDQSVYMSTYVSALDLVCGRAPLLSVLQTIYMTGCLCGSICFGQLSDRIGRRKTLVITLACEVVFATAATVSTNNYILTAIFRFLVGAAGLGVFTTIFVYGMEMIGPKYRVSTGIMVQLWFAVGLMILPLAAYFIRDHVHLQWLMAMTPVLMILYAFFIPESARWLISQGRDDEAVSVLRVMARFNRRKLPSPLNLHDNRQASVDASVQRTSFADLFRNSKLRKTTLLMWWAWFVTGMVYYGLSLGVNLIGGDIFFNSFLSGAIEIPSYFVVIPIMNRLGRRWTTVGSLLVASIACFICTSLLDQSGLYTVLVVFSMCGKFFIASTFAVIYVYSAELFPTVVRQVGVGSSSMCARIGGLIQPQFGRLNIYWSPLPFLLYGVAALSAGLTTLLLPETLNKTLPDTLEDRKHFGGRDKCCEEGKEKEKEALEKLCLSDIDNNIDNNTPMYKDCL